MAKRKATLPDCAICGEPAASLLFDFAICEKCHAAVTASDDICFNCHELLEPGQEIFCAACDPGEPPPVEGEADPEE